MSNDKKTWIHYTRARSKNPHLFVKEGQIWKTYNDKIIVILGFYRPSRYFALRIQEAKIVISLIYDDAIKEKLVDHEDNP